MNITHECIVGLWFLPVILNIAVPLVMLICWLIILTPYKFLTRTIQKKIPQEPVKEKRIGKRVSTAGMNINVSDGVNQLAGQACNISKMGICIMGLPEKVFNKAEHLAVVMEDKGEQFSLEVSPRWEKTRESSKKIGAKVDFASVGWLEYVEIRSRC